MSEEFNIRRNIIKVCDEFIELYAGLKKEMEQVPEKDIDKVIEKWQSYFQEHHQVVADFIEITLHIDIYKEETK